MSVTGSLELIYQVLPINLTGSLELTYQVLPIGASDLNSTGKVNQHGNLPSVGHIAIHGSLIVQYEILERPKTTVVITPVADAFITDAKPTINYGDVVDLVIGRYNSKLSRALLQFDISTLRTDLDIISAKLRLFARITKVGEIAAYNLLGSWEELGVTWANQPGRYPVAENQALVSEVVDLDITGLFLGWYKQTRANNGIMILAVDEQIQAHSVYTSREWPEAVMRPQLLVTYYDPDASKENNELFSTGRVIGYAWLDLPSTGIVVGAIAADNDLNSLGAVSRKDIFSIGTVRQISDLESVGIIRGTRVADDFSGQGAVSRRDIPSTGTPRISGEADLSSRGYILEHNDLPSVGQPRVPSENALTASGYVSGAANELASKGVVDGYYDDLPSSGNPRVYSKDDLMSGGYISGAANELPSRGHLNSMWLRSSGIVHQISDLYSTGSVNTGINLPSTGIIPFSDKSDLPGAGTSRVRDVSEILSTGYVRCGQSDLPSKGHVGPWVLEIETVVGTWPPEGRSVE